MFENMSIREKIIIAVGLMIIIISAYYFYIYLPYTQQINSLEQTLKQKQNNIDSLKEMALNKKNLEEKYNNMQKKLAVKDKKEEVSSKYETTTSDILKYFNKKTNETAISMNNFSANEDKEKVEINFSYSADFYEVISFFSEINKFQKFIGYENLTINNNQGQQLSISTKIIFPKKDEMGDKNE